jgi:hypothetical protein
MSETLEQRMARMETEQKELRERNEVLEDRQGKLANENKTLRALVDNNAQGNETTPHSQEGDMLEFLGGFGTREANGVQGETEQSEPDRVGILERKLAIVQAQNAEQAFYGKYPELNTPAMRSVVRGVASEVAKEASERGWDNNRQMDEIAKRAKDPERLTAAIEQMAAVAGVQVSKPKANPDPAGSNDANPTKLGSTSKDTDEAKKQVLELQSKRYGKGGATVLDRTYGN